MGGAVIGTLKHSSSTTRQVKKSQLGEEGGRVGKGGRGEEWGRGEGVGEGGWGGRGEGGREREDGDGGGGLLYFSVPSYSLARSSRLPKHQFDGS